MTAAPSLDQLHHAYRRALRERELSLDKLWLDRDRASQAIADRNRSQGIYRDKEAEYRAARDSYLARIKSELHGQPHLIDDLVVTIEADGRGLKIRPAPSPSSGEDAA